ncbi:hypothetical protein [Bradyrhizobium lablabi]|uniref:hypothetical protein n=1 Tax=Bradyrhizobium lablabi TaxID=722472 RepID=UPI001BAA2C0B|nr:hypothetical protein [Bradyrhizobium lablabi]MBR0696880.1 hypothetical protein [Bradyrhizobium lablabi]
MADAIRAAFSPANAALCIRQEATDMAMVELLLMAQMIRNPVQAFARRWWCKSMFRATRGQRRCPECTAS